MEPKIYLTATMEYTIEECSLQSVRPDVEIKSSRPNVSKSCPKRSYNSFLTRSDFYLSPKSHHTFWLLFEDNLSPKNFQKPPNLFTLALIACVSNRQMVLEVTFFATMRRRFVERQFDKWAQRKFCKKDIRGERNS